MFTSRSVASVLTAMLLVGAGAASAQPRGRGAMRGLAAANVSRLDAQVGNAILGALDDERMAKAFYSAVIARYGQVPPFSNIVNAEARHESALVALLGRYAIAVPADPWASRKVEVPATLQAALLAAMKIERENIAMYDGFLKFVKEEDIRAVMTQLQWASQSRHLPALERRAGVVQGPGQAAAAPTAAAVAPPTIPQAAPASTPGAAQFACRCCGVCLVRGQGAATAATTGQMVGRGMGWQGGRGAGRGAGGMGGQGQGRGWRGGRGQ